MVNQPLEKFQAIVLAGDRGSTDPVALHANAPCKALAEIQGRPILLRVLDVLIESDNIAEITIVGPNSDLLNQCPELVALIESGVVTWVAPATTPCTSAQAALAAANNDLPTLITTADHGFLSLEILTEFFESVHEIEADTVAALVSHEIVTDVFPSNKRTALRFRDGAFCGCNLFAIKTSQGALAIDYWRRVENLRKTPWRIAGVISFSTLILFLLGRLTVAAAMKGLTRKIGAQVSIAFLRNADAAIDIDSAADWDLVDRELQDRQSR